MASIIQTKTETGLVLCVIVPLIIFGYAMFSPHISHPEHFLHVAIHEAGLIISGFLLSMTLLAYRRFRLPRMIFSAAAFAILTCAQGIYLFLDQNLSDAHVINYFSANEIFDVLIVVMTMLFALGVFYNSKTKKYF